MSKTGKKKRATAELVQRLTHTGWPARVRSIPLAGRPEALLHLGSLRVFTLSPWWAGFSFFFRQIPFAASSRQTPGDPHRLTQWSSAGPVAEVNDLTNTGPPYLSFYRLSRDAFDCLSDFFPFLSSYSIEKVKTSRVLHPAFHGIEHRYTGNFPPSLRSLFRV